MNRFQGSFGVAVWVLVAVSLVLMLAPLVIITCAAFDPVSLRFPVKGFTVKWFIDLLHNSKFINAAWVSVGLSLAASIASSLLALLAAVGLRYCTPQIRNCVNMIMLSPMFVPSIVLGLALYQLVYIFFGTRMPWMLGFGLTISVIVIPLRIIIGSLEGLPRSLDDAAMSVGCHPFRMIFSILLPLIKPGFFSGWLLAFIHVWNDFNISIWLASPKFYPLSIQLYAFTKEAYTPVLAAISVCLIAISSIIVLVMNKTIGLSGVTGIRST